MLNPNLEQLIAAAALLRPMLEDLVFVGGAVTSLLVTDEGAGRPRTTLDVDAIVENQLLSRIHRVWRTPSRTRIL